MDSSSPSVAATSGSSQLWEECDLLQDIFGNADERSAFVPNSADAKLPEHSQIAAALGGEFRHRAVAVGHASSDVTHCYSSQDGPGSDLAFLGQKKESQFAQSAPVVAGFAAPQMQPFFEDSTVTQFISARSPVEICDCLLNAMKANDCMYDVDRSEGVIKLTSFVDHSRVSATMRIYAKSPTQHLVHYGRTFGDRIPATRLFFSLANDSGLISLQVPRLLRRSAPRECCAAAARDGAEAKASPHSFTPTATTVFVEMLGSVFAEEALVGAQGLARACCCSVSAKPYVPHLAAIINAYTEHQQSGSAGHLVSRDIVTCLASVVAKVGIAGQQTAGCEAAVEPMLQCAASEGGDAECARASLIALASLCCADESLKTRVQQDFTELVHAAVDGSGPCSSGSETPSFLRAAAMKLKTSLGLSD